MNKNDKKRFSSRVLEELMNVYNLSENEANIMAEKYFLEERIDNDPNYMMHYSARYWAENIYQENLLIRS